MHKALTIFFAITTLVLGLFLAVFAIRFEVLRTESTFLMKLAGLEHATISEYEAEFGKPLHNAQSAEELHPELAQAVEGKLVTGQTAYFFQAHTIPHKYLVVICNADGSIAWRTWVQM